MKTLLNLSAILFCAMLVSCIHKREARQDERSRDEPSKIVNADNTGTDVDPANRNGKSPIEPNVTPAEATVNVVIPREFFAEYERDEVAFTGKYKDGAIEMTGEAIMVANAFDAPFIKLNVGRDETTGVHCFTKDKQPWAIVVPGQQVTLRGKLPSRLFGAQVQDCDILETGPSPAIKIDAAALASEYAADPNACSEKYKEKYLYVDGTVEAIDTKAGIVHLAGNDGVRIRCSFHTYGEKEQIPSLKPGNQVHVIGQYPRFGGNDTEMQLVLCLLYDPSQIKPVPALKADSKRTADSTTVLARYPDDFRPNASGHTDSSGHGKWFYQSSETQNPSSPEANLRQLSWDQERKRYESPLRGKNNTFPSIDQRMHPSPDPPHFAVLRWQSLDSANIRVRGNFSKLADAKESNGVRALVFVDGEQVFDQEVGPRDAKGFDFDFAALVKPDSVVDFVVDPKQDAYWDSTKLIVTIEQSIGNPPSNSD